MLFTYSVIAVPAALLLSLAVALFLVTAVTPDRPEGELVPINDLLEEDEL